ncbi:hypothetical protein [Gilvibacter sediminis]|uniref:hypothetical protein n=1 Tax=Gilvibacter sediminis TaxID=379071 RepID=UPI00235020FC|nr:hypothetical protein [Gilvibacter sediminis]MDC7998402.1 hypothetical protein [Gilvibacter sediminis]
MDHKKIVLRLKEARFKSLEVMSIKRELRKLPLNEQVIILGKLEQEKQRSDNSDVMDVINEIINDFKPPKR